MLSRIFNEQDGQLSVNFGYRCLSYGNSKEISSNSEKNTKEQSTRSTFSCLSGAALSANTTLANTDICNGLIGTGILPGLDSPRTFQRVPSSPSLSSADILSTSLQSNTSYLTGCMSSQSDATEWDTSLLKPMSAPCVSESFLDAMEVQMAGGAAGEDRVQAVCSEENGWLFCAIYDGFNGRDAADYLAGTLYENIRLNLNMLLSEMKHNISDSIDFSDSDVSIECSMDNHQTWYNGSSTNLEVKHVDGGIQVDTFRHGVLCCLQRALAQAESDFLSTVELAMDDRPDLVSIGSCVLVVLLHGQDLYVLGLGDSRAILATKGSIDVTDDKELKAIQLTDYHSVDNEVECERILSEHSEEFGTIIGGRVKGKLKLTRAFGVGYLKKKNLNDALMGILRVQNLISPPYISTQPSLSVHRISKCDYFAIVASDGLFDFFTNDEAVELVHSFIMGSPMGNPAEYLVEQLVARAAKRAGLTFDELLNIPAGRKRKYHDDVTVMVVLLGNGQRTSTASTHQ